MALAVHPIGRLPSRQVIMVLFRTTIIQYFYVKFDTNDDDGDDDDDNAADYAGDGEVAAGVGGVGGGGRERRVGFVPRECLRAARAC